MWSINSLGTPSVSKKHWIIIQKGNIAKIRIQFYSFVRKGFNQELNTFSVCPF